LRRWCFAATIVPIERKAALRGEVVDRVAVVTESSACVPQAAQEMMKRVNALAVLDTLFCLARGERAGSRPVCVNLMHANVPEEAEKLRAEILCRFECAEFYTTGFAPVMGANIGPGSIGLS